MVSVPLGWVPKTHPDRTVSTDEGRIVHDPKTPNAGAVKELFFPATMPKHSDLARLILWWAVRLPGIKIFLAKKDVADAFKWLWILAESCHLFACDFKSPEGAHPENLICLWLTLNFGWRGGPDVLYK